MTGCSLLERELPGKRGPGLVVLTGMSKPRGTGFTVSEYRSVVRLREEFLSGEPRSVTRG